MEALLMGQVRGYLILANGHKREGNIRLYFHYLLRSKEILNIVQTQRAARSLRLVA
jgi:hypothetical protein